MVRWRTSWPVTSSVLTVAGRPLTDRIAASCTLAVEHKHHQASFVVGPFTWAAKLGLDIYDWALKPAWISASFLHLFFFSPSQKKIIRQLLVPPGIGFFRFSSISSSLEDQKQPKFQRPGLKHARSILLECKPSDAGVKE